MGSFHTNMEVRTPAVGNVIILLPDIINRNTLLPEIDYFVHVRGCFRCICFSQAREVNLKCWPKCQRATPGG